LGEAIKKERIKSEFKKNQNQHHHLASYRYNLSMIALGTFFTAIGDLEIPHDISPNNQFQYAAGEE
jgi:hypothetical protein